MEIFHTKSKLIELANEVQHKASMNYD